MAILHDHGVVYCTVVPYMSIVINCPPSHQNIENKQISIYLSIRWFTRILSQYIHRVSQSALVVVSVCNISGSKKVFSTTLNVLGLKKGNCQLKSKTQFMSNINLCLAGIRIQTEQSTQSCAVTPQAPVTRGR